MAETYVLVDASVVEQLETGTDGVWVIEKNDFGDGTWLLWVFSPDIPAGIGQCLELALWDTEGPIRPRFKTWLEV